MIVVTERANEREKKIEGEMRVRHGVRDRDWEMCENETDSILVHIRGYCSIIVKKNLQLRDRVMDVFML